MSTPLPEPAAPPSFTFLELSTRGLFVAADGAEVAADAMPRFLRRQLDVPRDATDVFVWVHGWRNDRARALATAARLFDGIEQVYRAQRGRYPRLAVFRPHFVAVHWPSESWPTAGGYRKIRDRAHGMTIDGAAEYALASLLGYLEEQNPGPRPTGPSVLRARAGYFVHCVGHSFGGRFLAQAIFAAAEPSPPTLALLPENARFEFTVDNFLVFQMAAKPDFFASKVRAVHGASPLSGPVCLTYSPADTANCKWHRRGEGVPAIGCSGAVEPAGSLGWSRILPLDHAYDRRELAHVVVNLDAGWIYREQAWFTGAHSDFWYQESIHLLLSLVDFAR